MLTSIDFFTSTAVVKPVPSTIETVENLAANIKARQLRPTKADEVIEDSEQEEQEDNIGLKGREERDASEDVEIQTLAGEGSEEESYKDPKFEALGEFDEDGVKERLGQLGNTIEEGRGKEDDESETPFSDMANDTSDWDVEMKCSGDALDTCMDEEEELVEHRLKVEKTPSLQTSIPRSPGKYYDEFS